LEVLDVSENRRVTDKALLAAAKYGGSLREVVMAGCVNLTGAGVLSFAKSKSEATILASKDARVVPLTLFNLNYCENLRNDAVCKLKALLPKTILHTRLT
jgi:hypothetical protein